MDLNDIAVDEELAEKGTWISFDGETEFLLAHTGGPTYKKTLSDVFRRHQTALRMDLLSEEAQRGALAEVYAKSIVLGWRGLTKNGEEFECNYENCINILLKNPKLFDWVIEQADSLNNFLKQKIAADVAKS